jgi:hypothetical protein
VTRHRATARSHSAPSIGTAAFFIAEWSRVDPAALCTGSTRLRVYLQASLTRSRLPIARLMLAHVVGERDAACCGAVGVLDPDPGGRAASPGWSGFLTLIQSRAF